VFGACLFVIQVGSKENKQQEQALLQKNQVLVFWIDALSSRVSSASALDSKESIKGRLGAQRLLFEAE